MIRAIIVVGVLIIIGTAVGVGAGLGVNFNLSRKASEEVLVGSARFVSALSKLSVDGRWS